MVSIHAPARRATTVPELSCAAYPMFQSTPPHGGRRERSTWLPVASPRFNPRPRTEGDHSSSSNYRTYGRCFNPRPRTGGDSIVTGCHCHDCRGFNPRPRTEGDLGSMVCDPATEHVSIHAPARRATVKVRLFT